MDSVNQVEVLTGDFSLKFKEQPRQDYKAREQLQD